MHDTCEQNTQKDYVYNTN